MAARKPLKAQFRSEDSPGQEVLKLGKLLWEAKTTEIGTSPSYVCLITEIYFRGPFVATQYEKK